MATDDPFAELFGDVDLPEPRTWRDEVAAVVELEDETEAAEQLVRAIEAVFRDAPKLVTKPQLDRVLLAAKGAGWKATQFMGALF